MATYKVLAGQHYEKDADGQITSYDEDDIVTTDKPLDEMFRGKFAKLSDDLPRFTEPPIAKSVEEVEVVSEEEVQKDADAEEHADVVETDETPEETTSTNTIDTQPVVNIPVETHPRWGVERTQDFPTADLLNLKVYWKEDRFKVVDPETNKSINRKKLSVVSKVDEFLKAQLEA